MSVADFLMIQGVQIGSFILSSLITFAVGGVAFKAVYAFLEKIGVIS